NLLGLTEKVARAEQERPEYRNALSVRLELQADCLAGVWARSTQERQILESGDVDEALGAAAAVGDDRLQKMARGRGQPETLPPLSSKPMRADDLDATSAARFAKLALDCVAKEYPNKIGHVLNGDADVLPPRELTPAFFGCYDWHSAVHAHWLLARLARTRPD